MARRKLNASRPQSTVNRNFPGSSPVSLAVDPRPALKRTRMSLHVFAASKMEGQSIAATPPHQAQKGLTIADFRFQHPGQSRIDPPQQDNR